MVGPWSVPRSLQIVGWMHERRRHFASTSGRVHRILYMFAVGPPTSLIVPLNAGSCAMRRTSPTIDAGLRLWIDAALVHRDAAERAAAEAAPHDRHRVLDHLVGGDRLAVARVGRARTGRS